MIGHATRSFALPAHPTVLASELIAILKALHFVEMSDDVFNVAFSDSLSSLLAMGNLNTHHPVLRLMLSALTSVDRAGKGIMFWWLPSYVPVV